MGMVLALVKFNNSQILIGAYDTMLNRLHPKIINYRSLKQHFHGDYLEFVDSTKFDSVPKCIDESVRIYADTQDGIVWTGKASLKNRIITSGFTHVNGRRLTSNIPLWVYEWLINHGYNPIHLEDRITDPKFKHPVVRRGDYVYLVRSPMELSSCKQTRKLSEPLSMKVRSVTFNVNGPIYKLTHCSVTNSDFGTNVFVRYDSAWNYIQNGGNKLCRSNCLY